MSQLKKLNNILFFLKLKDKILVTTNNYNNNKKKQPRKSHNRPKKRRYLTSAPRQIEIVRKKRRVRVRLRVESWIFS